MWPTSLLTTTKFQCMTATSYIFLTNEMRMRICYELSMSVKFKEDHVNQWKLILHLQNIDIRTDAFKDIRTDAFKDIRTDAFKNIRTDAFKNIRTDAFKKYSD